MICTFCFKPVNYCRENESKDLLLFKRFINLVQRYFGKNFELKAGVLNELESCQDCKFLIKSFCDFYNELRCLELQLELKVQKMLEVVTAAERVPLSTRLAKEKLESREHVVGGSLYEVVCEFRKDFIRKCTRHLSSSLPRVLVERIENVNNDKSLIKHDKIILKTNTNGSSEMVENGYLLLGWISTLVGVVWLGWSCWTRTPTLTTTTFSDDNNRLKIRSIYRKNDDVSSTATRCNRTPHEESFRPDSSSNSQSTIFENEENPETVSVCHTITSTDASPLLWKDNLIPNAHVELNPPPPAENVTLAVVPKASTRSGKIMTQFVCDLCRKGFKSKTSLVRHKQTVHVSRDQWPYYCSLCNRRYSTLCNFKRHKKTIEHKDKLKIQSIYLEDDKVYSIATRCNPTPQDKYFGTGSSSNSQSPILQHENSGTVPVCQRITSSDICPPSWNHSLTSDTYVELKKESIILVHPQPDPAENVAIAVDLKASAKSGKLMTQYVCDLCQKKLKSKISLVRHKKTVHVSRDQWPYYCCICNRRYSTHCHLKRHNKSVEHNFRKSLDKVRRGKRHQ